MAKITATFALCPNIANCCMTITKFTQVMKVYPTILFALMCWTWNFVCFAQEKFQKHKIDYATLITAHTPKAAKNFLLNKVISVEKKTGDIYCKLASDNKKRAYYGDWKVIKVADVLFENGDMLLKYGQSSYLVVNATADFDMFELKHTGDASNQIIAQNNSTSTKDNQGWVVAPIAYRPSNLHAEQIAQQRRTNPQNRFSKQPATQTPKARHSAKPINNSKFNYDAPLLINEQNDYDNGMVTDNSVFSKLSGKSSLQAVNGVGRGKRPVVVCTGEGCNVLGKIYELYGFKISDNPNISYEKRDWDDYD